MSELKNENQIINDAPIGAITYCKYEYGDNQEFLYLNSNGQFFCDEGSQWVDMELVENYFHGHRSMDDILQIAKLRHELNTKNKKNVMNHELIEFAEKTQAWHENRVKQLKLIIENPKATFDLDGEEIEGDSDIGKGIRMGAMLSLNLLGELPFEVQHDDDTQPQEEA